MIKVETNKNIIFLTLLINYFYPKDKEKFYLYKKVIKKFDKLIPKSFKNDFQNEYKGENPLAILCRYISLSVYLDEGLLFNFNKKEEQQFLKIEKFAKDISFFKNHLKNFYDSIDFDSFYRKNIETEYRKLCKEIEEIFNSKTNITNVLVDYWGLKYQPEVIFIPNFVALGDCFGVRREEKFFSITSPKINKQTGISEYSLIHIYSNTLHELSHSFFKETIATKYSKDELREKAKKLKLNEDVLKVYGGGYFEECFVIASTIRLKEVLNVYDLDKRSVAEKVKKSLLSEDNMGYGLVRNYYERLSSRKEESLQMIFNSLV